MAQAPPDAPPIVRPAQEGDVEALAEVITSALDDKFHPAYGSRAAAAVAALARAELAHGEGRYLVAEEGGAVVGAVRLVLSRPHEDRVGVLAAAIGWPRAMRAALVLGLLAHTGLADDEAYLEELGVDVAVRRRGVGRALVAACERASRAAGKRVLTLWVMAGNAPARALYDQEGFVEVRRIRTLRGRILFRAPVAILMAKRLRPD